jgi:UDP-4-amino-4,6-dideoxy-N-acetyl-beta-L-altrosamine transaminase
MNVLETDFITQGPKVKEFEVALAEYVGAKYAVVCSNGTAALHLACLACGLGKGGKLVTSPITFLASANCAQFVGADTFFSDIDSDSWCLSITDLARLLEKEKIDVVVPVHYAGHSAEMESLYRLKQKYEFWIIEDASHALGGTYKNSKVGSCTYSDMSTFSFHPVKPITTGEGGAITTNDDSLYERLIRFRTHGMTKNSDQFKNIELAYDEMGRENIWYYEMDQIGFNYRATDIQCALGINQLRKIDRFIERRRQIAEIYSQGFKRNSFIRTPIEANYIGHAYHLYTLLINFNSLGKCRNQVMLELRDYGVGSQVLYIPIHFQPFYKEKYGYAKGSYAVAETFYEGCLSIPMFPGMTDTEVEYVVDTVNSVAN